MLEKLKRTLGLELMGRMASRFPFWKDALVFLLMTGWSFWIYRSGLAAFPREDHFSFIRDRWLLNSDWDFLLHALSYSRTRFFFQGDYYLFRPAMHGLLALIDIFFRHNLYVVGALSIVWHGICSFFLYLVISKIVNRPSAFLMSAVFVTQYAGMEMIVWRHISPYMFGIFFFGLGMLVLHQSEGSRAPKKMACWAGFLFLLSALFQETAVIVLTGAGILFLTMRKIPGQPEKKSALSRSDLIAVCFIPVFIFLAANWIDWAWHHPPGFLGPNDRFSKTLTWTKVLSDAGFVSGVVFLIFLAPFPIRIEYRNPFDRAFLDFAFAPSWVIYSSGALLLVILIVFGYLSYLHFKKRGGDKFSLMSIFLIGYFFAVLAGLVIGRVELRTMAYLYTATYYYYLTNFILFVITALLIRRVKERFPGSVRFSQLFMFLLILAAACQIAFSYENISNSLSVRKNYDETVAQSTYSIWKTAQQHPDYCYGGSFNTKVNEYVPSVLLYKILCSSQSDSRKTPFYLTAGSDGQFWLATLENRDRDLKNVPLDLTAGNFKSENGLLFSANPSDRLQEGQGIVLSEIPYNFDVLKVRIHNSADGGVVIGYKNPENFILLVINHGDFYVHLMRGGTLSPPILQAWDLIKQHDFELTVRQFNEQFVVFCDGQALGILSGVGTLDGKVGLYDFRSRDKKQAFSDVMIAEHAPSPKNSLNPVCPVTLQNLQNMRLMNSSGYLAPRDPQPAPSPVVLMVE